MAVIESSSLMESGSSVSPSKMPSGFVAFEHLHLHLRRTHWETKYHPNLGTTLQDALDLLDQEGWQVVSAFSVDRSTEVILRRPR